MSFFFFYASMWINQAKALEVLQLAKTIVEFTEASAV